jgi:hypothetical protein
MSETVKASGYVIWIVCGSGSKIGEIGKLKGAEGHL